MPGHIFQAVGFEIARAHVVVLDEDPGVHDVATRDLVAAVRDGALGHLHPGRMPTKGRAVAPPPELDAALPGPGLHVLEVEAEDVLALDDVWVAFADQPGAFPQHLRLAHLAAREHALPPP